MNEKLTKIKEHTNSEVIWKEKLFAKELYFLKLEMNAKKAHKKMESALDILYDIDNEKLCFYNQSNSEIGQLPEMIGKVTKSYLKTLCYTFDISEISDESVGLGPGEMLQIGLEKYLYREAGDNELQFLGEKINEYKDLCLKKKAEIEAANSTKNRNNRNLPALPVKPDINPFQGEKDENYESNKLVVELEQIPNLVIKKFRHDFAVILLEEFQEFRVKQTEDLNNKMKQLVRTLTHNRHSEIQDLEIRIAEIEEISRKRIQDIDRLHVLNDNEAEIILKRMQMIKEDYIESTKKIEYNCSLFISKIQSELQKELWTAKTPADMDFLMQDFRVLSQDQVDRIQNLISKAGKQFEKGRKAMVNTQAPQQHAQAWEILSERGHHPDTDIKDLDNLKDEFFSKQADAFNQLTDTINQTLTEMQFHLDDLSFLEKVKRNLNDLKMKLLGMVSTRAKRELL